MPRNTDSMGLLIRLYILPCFFFTALAQGIVQDTTSLPGVKIGTITAGSFPEFVPMDVTATIWNNMACGAAGMCKNKSIIYECPAEMFQCTTCRCDSDCVRYRDCCPDADLWTIQNGASRDSAVSTVDYQCVYQAFKKGWSIKSIWYAMVATCPESGGTETQKQQCENPDKNELLANRPIYSTHTKRTYRNMQCAACHGEIETDHVIPWKINITCSGYVDYNRIATPADFYTEALSNKHCAINMEPPLANITRECVEWADDVISRCNVTGLYREYYTGESAILQKACASFQQTITPVITPFRFPSGTYRNIFCAVCNGLRIERALLNVPPCVPLRRDAFIPPFSAPLSVLFDFNPKVLHQDPVKRVTALACQDDSVYDVHHDTCRPLSCPYGMFALNHTCDSVMTTVQGQGYQLYAGLSPNYPIELKSRDLRLFADLFIQEQKVLYDYFASVRGAINLKIFFFVNRLTNKSTIANMTLYCSFVNGRLLPRQQADRVLLNYMTENWYYYMNERKEFVEFKKSALPLDEGSVALDTDVHEMMDTPPGDIYFTSQTFRHMYDGDFSMVYETNSSLYIWVNELMRCPSIVLNDTEYTRLRSSVYVHAMNKTLGPLEYSIWAGEVSICSQFSGTYEQVVYVPANRTVTSLDTEEAYIQTVLSIVCTTVSCLGLVITIIVYFLVRSLRTLPGKCNMLLFMNLLIAQIIFQGGVRATVSHTGCVVLGMLIHYFWLAVFGWKWICAFHMFRTFTQPLRRVAKCKTLTVYCILAQGIPMLVVILYAALHAGLAEDHSPGYGVKGLCFISTPLYIGIAFALPVGIVLVSNGCFFTKIVITFHHKSEIDKSSCRSNLQQTFILLKMSLLLGFTWAVGFVAAATQLSAFWYIFIILNASPGVFIFFTYVMNKRVLTHCGVIKKKKTKESASIQGTLTNGHDAPHIHDSKTNYSLKSNSVDTTII